jgi:hypothetical protein
MHAPAEQAALVHATAAPQVPVGLHVSTPLLLLSQRFAPGVHDPVHEPPTHARFTQVDGVPQAPVGSHVDTALSELPSEAVAHSVDPGEHTP